MADNNAQDNHFSDDDEVTSLPNEVAETSADLSARGLIVVCPGDILSPVHQMPIIIDGSWYLSVLHYVNYRLYSELGLLDRCPFDWTGAKALHRKTAAFLAFAVRQGWCTNDALDVWRRENLVDVLKTAYLAKIDQSRQAGKALLDSSDLVPIVIGAEESVFGIGMSLGEFREWLAASEFTAPEMLAWTTSTDEEFRAKSVPAEFGRNVAGRVLIEVRQELMETGYASSIPSFIAPAAQSSPNILMEDHLEDNPPPASFMAALPELLHSPGAEHVVSSEVTVGHHVVHQNGEAVHRRRSTNSGTADSFWSGREGDGLDVYFICEESDPLHEWHTCPFTSDGITYQTVGQFVVYHLVMQLGWQFSWFTDAPLNALEQILAAASAEECTQKATEFITQFSQQSSMAVQPTHLTPHIERLLRRAYSIKMTAWPDIGHSLRQTGQTLILRTITGKPSFFEPFFTIGLTKGLAKEQVEQLGAKPILQQLIDAANVQNLVGLVLAELRILFGGPLLSDLLQIESRRSFCLYHPYLNEPQVAPVLCESSELCGYYFIPADHPLSLTDECPFVFEHQKHFSILAVCLLDLLRRTGCFEGPMENNSIVLKTKEASVEELKSFVQSVLARRFESADGQRFKAIVADWQRDSFRPLLLKALNAKLESSEIAATMKEYLTDIAAYQMLVYLPDCLRLNVGVDMSFEAFSDCGVTEAELLSHSLSAFDETVTCNDRLAAAGVGKNVYGYVLMETRAQILAAIEAERLKEQQLIEERSKEAVKSELQRLLTGRKVNTTAEQHNHVPTVCVEPHLAVNGDSSKIDASPQQLASAQTVETAPLTASEEPNSTAPESSAKLSAAVNRNARKIVFKRKTPMEIEAEETAKRAKISSLEAEADVICLTPITTNDAAVSNAAESDVVQTVAEQPLSSAVATVAPVVDKSQRRIVIKPAAARVKSTGSESAANVSGDRIPGVKFSQPPRTERSNSSAAEQATAAASNLSTTAKRNLTALERLKSLNFTSKRSAGDANPLQVLMEMEKKLKTEQPNKPTEDSYASHRVTNPEALATRRGYYEQQQQQHQQQNAAPAPSLAHPGMPVIPDLPIAKDKIYALDITREDLDALDEAELRELDEYLRPLKNHLSTQYNTVSSKIRDLSFKVDKEIEQQDAKAASLAASRSGALPLFPPGPSRSPQPPWAQNNPPRAPWPPRNAFPPWEQNAPPHNHRFGSGFGGGDPSYYPAAAPNRMYPPPRQRGPGGHIPSLMQTRQFPLPPMAYEPPPPQFFAPFMAAAMSQEMPASSEPFFNAYQQLTANLLGEQREKPFAANAFDYAADEVAALDYNFDA